MTDKTGDLKAPTCACRACLAHIIAGNTDSGVGATESAFPNWVQNGIAQHAHWTLGGPRFAHRKPGPRQGSSSALLHSNH